MQKDSLGTEIELGDWLISAPKSGNLQVGRVTNVTNSRVTIEVEHRKAVFAHERGAPSEMKTSRRVKRDENGRAVYDSVNRLVFEEYEYESKDYTVVARRWATEKREAAWFNRIVIRKADGSIPEAWEKKMNGGYEGDLPV